MNTGNLEKQLILGKKKGKYKMSLEHLVVLESAQKKKKVRTRSNGHRRHLERDPR